MKNLVTLPETNHPYYSNPSFSKPATHISANGNLQLHQMVNNLLHDLLPLAVSKRTLILNEIPGSFQLAADENMVAYVLWNLMNRVVTTTANECIYIDAEEAGNCSMIRLKNVSNYFYRSFSGDLRQVQDIARQLGGSLHIENAGDRETTVCFVLGKNNP